MSSLDATLIQLPIATHEPSLLFCETSMLCRLRSDAIGLVCLFDACRSPDDWATAWAGWARHRQAWRFVRQSARTRLLQLESLDLLDPDTTTDRVASILHTTSDPHSALQWCGMWNAATQAVHWSQLLQLDQCADVDHALERYLGWILDRETELQLRLEKHAQQAVLDATGDVSAARRACFESVYWGGAREGGTPFLLIARVRRPAHDTGAARTTLDASAFDTLYVRS